MVDENHENSSAGYEKRDANVRSLTLITAISVLVIIVAVVFLWDFFVSTREEIYHEQVLAPVSPELEELRAADRKALTTYQLIDSTTNTYSIPIDRAIGLMATESAGTDRR